MATMVVTHVNPGSAGGMRLTVAEFEYMQENLEKMNLRIKNRRKRLRAEGATPQMIRYELSPDQKSARDYQAWIDLYMLISTNWPRYRMWLFTPVGVELINLRYLRGLTQADLAKILGRKPSWVRMAEYHHYHKTNFGDTQRVAAALGAHLELGYLNTNGVEQYTTLGTEASILETLTAVDPDPSLVKYLYSRVAAYLAGRSVIAATIHDCIWNSFIHLTQEEVERAMPNTPLYLMALLQRDTP